VPTVAPRISVGSHHGDPQTGTKGKGAGTLMIDRSRLLVLWAAGLPVGHSWLINDMDQRSHFMIKQSDCVVRRVPRGVDRRGPPKKVTMGEVCEGRLGMR
jgi:hypothetical protein